MSPASEPGGLLPGNADLTDIAARLPRSSRAPRTSSWNAALMAVITIVLVIGAQVITHRFALIYQELGVQLPATTRCVLPVWFHVAALAGLMLPCIWQFKVGRASWAMEVWFTLAALYFGGVAAALFNPLKGLRESVGAG